MDVLDQVLARAAADPGVRGVILTGSRARGVATEWSDYDVTVVVAEQAQPWRYLARNGPLDEAVCTVEALADTSAHGLRYTYRGAKVLLDRLDGGIVELVDKQATLSADEAVQHGRASLDAYVNQLYRAVKSYRHGFADAAYLDEAESVPWLLETVFALHGRLRPYNKYLQWELATFPLPDHWNTVLAPDRVLTAPLTLFTSVESLARRHGHADVLDAWGKDIDLVRAFADKAVPRPFTVMRTAGETRSS